MKSFVMCMCTLLLLTASGCYSTVEQGNVGLVKHPSGWSDSVARPGTVTVVGRDVLYQADATEDLSTVKCNVLVGGKVNLVLTIAVRYGLKPDDESVKRVFNEIKAVSTCGGQKHFIARKQLYVRYVLPVVESVPQKVLGPQPDVNTVLTNLADLTAKMRESVNNEISKTPMVVTSFEITNYDWPDVITNAQIELVRMQLLEQKQAAQVRADLQRIEGDLKIAESKKLIELKKAEAVAESIKIIKGELKDCPEYLQWHTIRAMSDAAKGPNNAFILYPYSMPGITQVPLLKQVLDGDKDTLGCGRKDN